MKTTYPGQLLNRQPSTVDGRLTLHSANLIQNSWSILYKYFFKQIFNITYSVNHPLSTVDRELSTLLYSNHIQNNWSGDLNVIASFAGAKSFFKGYDQQTAGLF
jgi:subtilase family serine protease